MSNNADASGSNDTIEYRMPYRLEESTNMFGKMTIEPKLILSTVDGSVLKMSSTRDIIKNNWFQRFDDEGNQDIYNKIQVPILKQKIEEIKERRVFVTSLGNKVNLLKRNIREADDSMIRLERAYVNSTDSMRDVYIDAINENKKDKKKIMNQLNIINNEYVTKKETLINESNVYGQFIIHLKRLRAQGY
tara:strand:+ start:117 stop:686 length:570 start_codon:yes stop_codon:yes gene_type:complete